MIQSSEEPEVVPFEVTIGLPEPKLNVLPEFVVAPTRWKYTAPEALTIRWNTLRDPAFI